MTVVDGGADAMTLVESEVRELVRRRGVDPVSQPQVMRRLVDDVLAEYEDRALSGAMPPLGERAAVGRHVYDNVAGFGPLQRHLDDPTVEEIWINTRLNCSSVRGPLRLEASSSTPRCGDAVRGSWMAVDTSSGVHHVWQRTLVPMCASIQARRN